MKKLFVIAAVLGGLWYYYGPAALRPASVPRPVTNAQAASEPATDPVATYRCDGRIYCSQMTSCEEATFFLRHCPGVKMDGNGDGVPCEQQWCR